jgi:cellobiose phosphorylase
MAALDAHLIKRGPGLVQLLDPPFDHMRPSPGYIQGYVPGVRENGGQYTHAAVWAAMAFAELGEGAKAWEVFELINPVRHGVSAVPEGSEGIGAPGPLRDPDPIRKYMVEPYVVAADVYGVEPHVGRGGWTWYTGSAGWMYRLLTESLLGLNVEEGRLRLAPLLRPGWDGYRMSLRHGGARYEIVVEAGDARRLSLDGAEVAEVLLRDDGEVHEVRLQLPPA